MAVPSHEHISLTTHIWIYTYGIGGCTHHLTEICNWVLVRSYYNQYNKKQNSINSRNSDQLFLLYLQILWPSLPRSPVYPGGLDQALTEAPSAHQRAPLRDRDGRGFGSSSQNPNEHVLWAPRPWVDFYPSRTSSCLTLHSVYTVCIIDTLF